ncbi:cytochrome ubiquinol oxidase subunit I [Agrobacterium rosae]|uniref:Cytochrome ubiquinol oxidase subunit I n=1 Tax=Agrobacterium rosae TaxID=1972867 RepID=A0AAW9FM14_9HYPH|nr:cytochrome ubiquinol oxidase subunit I [Agrobacterium rosae]MDX8304529.1 cytochrome ubiquinol oxidase subunit I [Agrobacterium rosae]
MFDGFSAELLARIQFAFTVSFHFIFPAFSIGTASYLAVLNALWLWKRDPVYLKLFEYWKPIFAITFGMGVVSGIVMSYQFGTNWAVFSDKVGPVIGPLMGYEVLTAFFLEAGFLGIALFGRKRVGDSLHMFAVAMVAVGTLISATWILSANSWMQTPQGFTIGENGQFLPADWWKIIFNPSFPYRLVHTVLAAFLTTAFGVGAVGAYHLLRDKSNRQARVMFSMAMWMAALVTPIQILVGDLHGINTLEHQPAKIAAMEGHYETHRGAPLILFGIPDDEAEVTKYAVEIPRLGSLILTHSLDGEIKGLKEWNKNDRPKALIPFITFRVMVGLGVLMLLVGVWSLWARWRDCLYDNRLLHRASLLMGPSGFVAVLAGWYTTEVGRQPYTVYGLLRTSDSLSPIDAPAVGASLIAFIIVYFIVFGAGVFYLLRLMRRTPVLDEDHELDHAPTRTAGITPGPTQNLSGGHHDV